MVQFEGRVYQFVVPKGFGGGRREGRREGRVAQGLSEQDGEDGHSGYCSLLHEYGAGAIISSGL